MLIMDCGLTYVTECLSGSTKSRTSKTFPRLQGKCAHAPTAISPTQRASSALELSTWKPGQCLILVDGRVMEWGSNLWLDKLYIRFVQTERLAQDVTTLFTTYSGRTYLTGITFQGDGLEAIAPIRRGVLAATGGQTKVLVQGTAPNSITLLTPCICSWYS